DAVRSRPQLWKTSQVSGWLDEIPGRVTPAHREAVRVREEIVHFESILPEVGVTGKSLDPVGGALLESGYRLRVNVEQSLTVVTDAAGGNDVIWERLARVRIVGRAAPAKECVRRVQQLAEIAAAHGERGHNAGGGLLFATADPFLSPQEEKLLRSVLNLWGI